MDVAPAAKAPRLRPLSPNIQIYRPQLTSVLSIANRITGVVLSVGAVGLVIWLSAAAAWPGSYAIVQQAIVSRVGLLVLFGFTFAFFLRLCGGIRHLVWDHRPRLRASLDLYIGMVRCGGERGPHLGGLGGRPLFRRVALMNRFSFRSPLGRAIGLGSAKSGSEHWLVQRITAVALVPLTLWFVGSIIAHAGSDYTAFTAWLRTPIAAGGMVLLLIALFHHTALGLQVMIEDYVHSGARFAAVIAIHLWCYGLAVVGVIATLRIAFGG